MNTVGNRGSVSGCSTLVFRDKRTERNDTQTNSVNKQLIYLFGKLGFPNSRIQTLLTVEKQDFVFLENGVSVLVRYL